jgi:hypothetical protein
MQVLHAQGGSPDELCGTPLAMMGVDTQIKDTCVPIMRHGNFNFALWYEPRHDVLQSESAIAHFIYRNDFVQRNAPKCFVDKQSASYRSLDVARDNEQIATHNC